MPARTSKPIDPWAALDDIVKQEDEPTGPEWFTVIQFSERYGISYAHADKKLRTMSKSGVLEKWTGTSSATKRTTSKYRLKKA